MMCASLLSHILPTQDHTQLTAKVAATAASMQQLRAECDAVTKRTGTVNAEITKIKGR